MEHELNIGCYCFCRQDNGVNICRMSFEAAGVTENASAACG